MAIFVASRSGQAEITISPVERAGGPSCVLAPNFAGREDKKLSAGASVADKMHETAKTLRGKRSVDLPVLCI